VIITSDIILIDLHFGSSPFCPDAPRPQLMGPLCPISIHGSSVPLLKLQLAPRLILVMSSGTKKKEPRYVWVKPKLHIHKECGPRFHPLFHSSYIMGSPIK